MLLAVIAASIAMVAVRLVITSSGENGSRSSLVTASQLASAAQARTFAELTASPLAPYSTVLADEAARICAPTGQVYQPGSAWPSTCGTEWTYDDVASSRTAYVRLTLPTPASPQLSVVSVGRSGRSTTGFVQKYTTGGQGRPVLFSGGSLDLADLGTSSGSIDVPGTLYSVGPLSWNGADTSKSLLLTENTFSPAPSGTSPVNPADRRFAAATADASATPHVDSVRTWVSAPHSAAQLRSSVQSLATLACPQVSPVNITSPKNAAIKRTSALCLHAGSEVITASGTSLSVPSTTQWLIIPNASNPTSGTASTVDVYYAAQPLYAAGASSCGSCDLMALVNDQIDPDREGGVLPAHPGFEASWTALGTFNLPSSTVISTDATTSFGLCGDGFMGGTCRGWGTSATGAKVTERFTLVAGSVDRPADVYLAGPVEVAGSNRATLVATGRIVVPYWARPAGVGLTVTADLVSLASSNAVMTAPSNAAVSESNTGGALVVRGTLMLASADVRVPGSSFGSYSFSIPANATRSIAPLSPSPSLNWVLTGSRRMTAVDIAALDN